MSNAPSAPPRGASDDRSLQADVDDPGALAQRLAEGCQGEGRAQADSGLEESLEGGGVHGQAPAPDTGKGGAVRLAAGDCRVKSPNRSAASAIAVLFSVSSASPAI